MDIPAKDWLTLLAMVQSLRVSIDVQSSKLSMLLDSLHERDVLDLDEVMTLQQSAKEFAHILLTDEVATERFGNSRVVLRESGVMRQPPALLGEQLSDAFERLIDTAASEAKEVVGMDHEEGDEG
ncbi:MAG: hypothetical protein OJF52_004236 [Nitrospira sp.]|jgi:hypothetical protein|nr:MAG: hypothetical protein OJF52_004236 [Nitrospira sp.]